MSREARHCADAPLLEEPRLRAVAPVGLGVEAHPRGGRQPRGPAPVDASGAADHGETPSVETVVRGRALACGGLLRRGGAALQLQQPSAVATQVALRGRQPLLAEVEASLGVVEARLVGIQTALRLREAPLGGVETSRTPRGGR